MYCYLIELLFKIIYFSNVVGIDNLKIQPSIAYKVQNYRIKTSFKYFIINLYFHVFVALFEMKIVITIIVVTC